ncbi:MAG: hypothetical protein RLZZ227_2631 [Pseudomonadota bacterium]
MTLHPKGELMRPPSELLRWSFIVLVLITGTGTSGVRAQAQYYVTPSVAVLKAYDDNLFFTADNAESDTFTRVSPAIEGGYESARVDWSVSYRFDGEAYDEFSALDSNIARRFADAEIAYGVNAKLLLAADVSYTLTNTPTDINLGASVVVPGLLLGRASAERLLFHPSIQYEVTPTTTASTALTVTHDRLADTLESDTQIAEVDFETRLSDVNALTYGYVYRRFEFDLGRDSLNNITVSAQDSHTPWIGFDHQFSARTSVAGSVGPRIYDDSVEPFVEMSIRHQYANGELQLGYERNETTVLGQIGRVESQTVSATLQYRIGANFAATLRPDYAKLSQNNSDVDIYGMGMHAEYRINNALSLTASYDLNQQEVDFNDGTTSSTTRSLAMLGFILTFPRTRDVEAR